MKQNSNVPAFLTKLWTLVEDSDTNEFICWNQNGQSFLVLDEQRFAKEILPKFFKHNNMASFVRQLNMYGFRKVIHMDTSIVKQERDGPIEFQHPFFKHGQDDLLENIKRKVSATKPEDGKFRQEDLSKIISTFQNVHDQHENLDLKLATLKRENEALWREVSELRQKHSHQQQVIKKILQFIVTLVRNNPMVSLKRKRPIMMNKNGSKSKFIQEIFDESVDQTTGNLNGINGLKKNFEDVVIYDVTDDTDNEQEIPEKIQKRSKHLNNVASIETIEVEDESDGVTIDCEENATSLTITESELPMIISESAPVTSSALQLNKPPAVSLDDPSTVMDSILNENGAISHNINLLGRAELMDYLDSIDCSLEDFQALLCVKQFGIDPDNLTDGSDISKDNQSVPKETSENNADKQLVQYTTCPLAAFLDGYSALPSETDSSVPDLNESLDENSEDPTYLLDAYLTKESPTRSKLIHLEPLTEAEASEATLFYLCKLSPETTNSESSSVLDV
ncbi:heat shock factor protein 2 [Erpetoichthys calabaricus]|uniref:Heat shock transcription factor 2 n=1 Tax=Erpetoichthys calabaricus TaxID=27687 RepID=A0A8C4RM93_ERPCA|nr:heat shock factor protein 2 [Erpetoichthys calabaricus]